MPTGERCARCGDWGEDGRTLWMACFYDMSELGIPLEEDALFAADLETLHKATEPAAVQLPDGRQVNITAGTVTCDGELTPMRLYKMRVCKACRAEWLGAIKRWYEVREKGE